MSTPPANQIERRLYSLDGIVIGTLLGSLVAGVYMMMSNYITLGSARLARHTLTGGMVLYTLVLVAGWAAPQSFWVAFVFAVGQVLVAYLLASRLQGASIRYYAKRGLGVHTMFRAVLVGVLAGVLSLFVVLFLYALLAL